MLDLIAAFATLSAHGFLRGGLPPALTAMKLNAMHLDLDVEKLETHTRMQELRLAWRILPRPLQAACVAMSRVVMTELL